MYTSEYRRKLTTPDQAVEYLKHSQTLIHGVANGEPPALLAAIAQRVRDGNLADIKVYTALPLEHAAKTILAPDLADRIEVNCWFVSSADRDLIERGINHFVPNELHQIPRLIRDFMKVDVVVATVSPMDKAGFFSLGTSNGYISTAARECGRLLVEVNPHMPRVFGDSLLHISEVDGLVENAAPIIEGIPKTTRPEDEAIGRFIAEMVPDGATLQLGIGAIPNAVCRYLDHRRDLGIHTELLVSGMVDLIRRGVITGRKKNLNPRKHVFTAALGDKHMYAFMHDNPSMASYPCDYTNDPRIIAQNDNLISINSTIEVDLLGQCNSEFLQGHEFSGTGGQLDFVRGAFHSQRGKSIIAFYSTTHQGAVSRVVPSFAAGTVVTTSRMDTHFLVTEFGAVNLKGKSTKERALDIISIAHPKFRDELLKEAQNMQLL